jgi:acrylyl-CoA reductase (NADPH)
VTSVTHDATSDLPASYRALVTSGDGLRPFVRPQVLASTDLPEHPVAVRVEASSLNYKDALAAAGRPGVMRRYPGTPGIDAAGTVLVSNDPGWQAGDAVIVTSFDLGMGTPGGLAELIRVPAGWLVAMPSDWDAADAMALGTAGLTAALALARLESVGLTPGAGPVAVTGAAGGVGSCAVALLAAAGFEVIAISGRSESQAERLGELGASAVWSRERLAEGSGPLRSADLAAAVDAVGGAPLAQLLARVRRGGAVAAAGTVAGAALATTVFPFVLRGVALLGIDSAEAPAASRAAAWRRLAAAGIAARLRDSVVDVDLDDVEPWLAALLEGTVAGRVRVVIAPAPRGA